MARIIVIGEGPDDVGKRRETESGEIREEGAAVLPVLVHRLLGGKDDVKIECRALVRGHVRSYARKVAYHLGEASRGGFDGAVVVIDRDRSPGHSRLKDLRAGVDLAREAQNPTAAAVGVAVECLEAWLLADAAALREALTCRDIDQPPAPESLDGAPGSATHPKAVLATYLEQDALPDRPRYERIRAIAQVIDLATVERACPAGFKPFAREVRDNLGDLAGKPA